GMRPRLIEREGPTGLIVTTTKLRLHPENETRLLSITTTDTPDQTRRILNAIAAGDAQSEPVNLQPWLELDRWLSTSQTRVSISFAAGLSNAIPVLAVRLRRDFSTVLSLIAAHAILHQATRARDEGGAIVATVEGDYAAIRDLISDLLSEGVGATVSGSVR